MKKIGCFKKEHDTYTGTISLFNLNVEVQITPSADRDSTLSADYVITRKDTGAFESELGHGWQKYSKLERIPYLEVSIDDPSCPRPINAILWKGEEGLHYLYWDRTVVGEHAAERLYMQEELKPNIGVARLPQKMTAYVRTLFPELEL